MKKDNPIVRYFRESWEELTHATWPTKQQAVNLSIIVIIFVFLAAILISAFDFIFNEGYQLLLGL
jgi:preprotein translocase subunit SecE